MRSRYSGLRRESLLDTTNVNRHPCFDVVRLHERPTSEKRFNRLKSSRRCDSEKYRTAKLARVHTARRALHGLPMRSSMGRQARLFRDLGKFGFPNRLCRSFVSNRLRLLAAFSGSAYGLGVDDGGEEFESKLMGSHSPACPGRPRKYCTVGGPQIVES